MNDIDSLLDDLDDIIDEPQATTQSEGGTQFFKPRPPSRDKTQAFSTNPKAKFAHTPPKRLSSGGDNNSINSNRKGNENRDLNGNSNGKPDEIDDILDLFDSPPKDHQMNSRVSGSNKKTPKSGAHSSSSSSSSLSSESTSIWTPDKNRNEKKIPSINDSSSGYQDHSENSSNSRSSSNQNSIRKLPTYIGSPDTHKFRKDQTSENNSVFTSGNSNSNSHMESISIPKIAGASSSSGYKDTTSSSISTSSSSSSSYNSGGGSNSLPPTSVSSSSVVTSGGTAGSKARCSKVMLGGSANTRGLKTSAFSKCLCDNLRCLQCNFQVKVFIGFAWDSSVDYMFLRNNMPTDSKLSSKLNSSPESAAYCCQCTSAHLSDERTLSQGAASDPQWICSGH